MDKFMTSYELNDLKGYFFNTVKKEKIPVVINK